MYIILIKFFTILLSFFCNFNNYFNYLNKKRFYLIFYFKYFNKNFIKENKK